VYAQVARQPEIEAKIRRKLTDWFEAVDVQDPGERLVIREIRQGKAGSESALVDLALAAERRGDLDAARDLYQQALRRSPTSWRAARMLGELYRHKLSNKAEALRLYEQAAANAPARGADRALIFREWGMLLRDSGDVDATDRAIEKFETALVETPNDVVCVHALATMLERKGMYRRVIELLGPLSDHTNEKTRKMALLGLLRAHERTKDVLRVAEIKIKLKDLEGV
jgi:tetratricopeptide (TPR) repeat protein